MAKKKKVAAKGTPSKSQAIRDQLKKTPNAPAAEIAAAVSKKVGEEVSQALVYNVKATGVGKKRRKKKATTRAAASANGVNAKLIKEAATLLQHAGDAKSAREALAVAEEVSKIVAK